MGKRRRHSTPDSEKIRYKMKKLHKKMAKYENALDSSQREKTVSPNGNGSNNNTSQSVLSEYPPKDVSDTDPILVPEHHDTEIATELDTEILTLLGEGPTVEKPVGEDLHKDISSRWNAIIQNGIANDIKAEIIKKYPFPGNSLFLEPPTLNEEVAAAITASVKNRDKSLGNRQEQLGAAITSIGRALTMLITEGNKLKIIETLCDSGRLLCDLQRLASKTRRGLISENLNQETREAALKVNPGSYLFGENLGERLKSSKAIKKSAQDMKKVQVFLKPKTQSQPLQSRIPPTNTVHKNNLNWRAPPRKQVKPYQGGGRTYPYQPHTPSPQLPPRKTQRMTYPRRQ